MISVLEKKADENYKAAISLSRDSYFNAATSRLYYSTYQLSLHILEKNRITIEEGRAPHQRNKRQLHNFIQQNEVDNGDVADIELLTDLHRHRKTADYDSSFEITKEDFDDYLSFANQLIATLNKYK